MANKRAVFMADISSMMDAQKQDNEALRKEEQQGRVEVPEVSQAPQVFQAPEIPKTPKKIGRPKRERLVAFEQSFNLPIYDELHRRMKQVKGNTDIDLRDQIYMLVADGLNRYFPGGMPNREGEELIKEFKKFMFGES